MNAKSSITSILGLALMVVPVSAKPVPIFSGKYANNYNQICQAVEDGHNPGSTYQGVFLTTFHPDTGTVFLEGYGISGSIVVWSGGTTNMTRSYNAVSQPYSNDAATATFNGVVYDVNYGPVKNGIAESATLTGIPYNVGPGCAVSILLIRQH